MDLPLWASETTPERRRRSAGIRDRHLNKIAAGKFDDVTAADFQHRVPDPPLLTKLTREDRMELYRAHINRKHTLLNTAL